MTQNNQSLLKTFLVLLLLSSFSFNSNAQSSTFIKGEEAKKIDKDFSEILVNENEIIQFIRFDRGANIDSSVDLASKFKLNDKNEFIVGKQFQSAKDQTTVLRMHQIYDGVKVVGGDYTVQVRKNRSITANGSYFRINNLNRNIVISKEKAVEIAISKVNAKSYMWENEANEAYIQKESNNKEASFYPEAELVISSENYSHENQLKFAYQIDVYASNPVGRYRIEVDAENGSIINNYNLLHTQSVQGTGISLYNGEVDLTLFQDGSNYLLNDIDRGQGIYTFDMQNDINYGNAVEFSETDNFFDNQSNNTGVSAHFGAAATYDFFFNNFGLNSFDGNGAAINSFVHFDTNYVNAFWDGQRMTYGDGDQQSTTALVSIDIVGHEIAHAVTQYSADLIYQYESGALNESFSDIFGQSIEFEAAPETASWNLADEIFTNGVDMIRSISDPKSQGQPDTYLGENWEFTDFDNGGVHINSGVQNYWFYLLVEGGTGVNDSGVEYQVPSIGLEKAQQIAFRNLFFYLNQSSQYVDARFGSEMAAVDLYGEGSPEYDAVRAAWNAVGVPSMDPEIVINTNVDLGQALLEQNIFTLPISNNGLSSLNISQLSIDDTEFTLPETPIEIQDGETYELEIVYNPTTLGVKNAVLSIVNNDSDVQVDLTVEVVEAPAYSLSQEQFNIQLLAGDSQTEEISIQNDNDYDLVFGIGTEQNVNTSATYAPSGKTFKEGKVELPGFNKIANFISADQDSISGGYSWSDEVSYDWYDIQTLGNPVSLSDDSNSGLVSLGFDFPFFDNTFNQVAIGSNGWISFTNQSGSIWNSPLPSTSAPANVVAIMASDLHPDAGSCHYYYDAANRRFIVQYTEWSSFGNRAASFDMQVHLYENGKIKLLYDKIDQANGSTVGIQNDLQDLGLTVAFNDANFFQEGYAIEIGQAGMLENWLSVAQDSISVPANSSATFTALVNSVGLLGGDYQSNIVLNLEGFQGFRDSILVNLTVVGSPNLEARELTLGQVFTNQNLVYDFFIKNIGTDELQITELALETANTEISFTLADSTIAPYDSSLLTVETLLTQTGDILNALLITSNDAENAITSFPITGSVVDPPVMNVDQSSLSTALLSGETDQQSIIIDNIDGNSALFVEILRDNFNYQGAQSEPLLGDLIFNSKYAGTYKNLEKVEVVHPQRKIVARSNSINSNGRLFTMNTGEPTIYELDTQSGEILNTINTGVISEGPEGLAYDGQYLYYNHGFNSQYIYKIDAENGQRLDSILLDTGITIDGLGHSGGALIAGSYSQGIIYEIDFIDRTVEPIIDNLSLIGGFSFGGERNSIFVSNAEIITEIDYETKEVIQSHTFDFPVYGIGYSKVAGKLFISNSFGNEILTVDPNDWSYEVFASGFNSYAMAADEYFGASSSSNNWLTTDFITDTIPAGTSSVLNVSFNAENLLGGLYTADLLINSNDPENQSLTIPVSMDVTGVPELSISQEDIIFSNILNGETETRTLNIRNTGTDLLVVDLALVGDEFRLDTTAFEIDPGRTESLIIYFEPTSIGQKSAVLTVNTNDENASLVDINLEGLVVETPNVSYHPTEISLNLAAGQELTEVISIENLVDYNLDLTFQLSQNNSIRSEYEQIEGVQTEVGKIDVPSFRKLVTNPLSNETDNEITGGYEFIDTNGGFAYNWYDIQDAGTSVNLSDDSNSGAIELGFNFEFFEQTFSSVNIGSNGWLSFTNNSGRIWSSPLPSSSAPENVIALLASDLYPGQGSCHYYFDENQSRFIVQYTAYSYCCSSNDYFTMQAQIYANGDIIILYDQINTNANGTVGIQNGDRTKGLTIAYDEPERIVSGYGVKISNGINWISLPSSTLNLEASSSSDFSVDLNTQGLIAGSYSANILVSELEFGTDLTSIPVNLEVSGASFFDIDVDQIDFGNVIIGDESTLEFTINNLGNDELTVEMSTTNDVLTFSESSLSIPAFQSYTTSITLSPEQVGNLNSELNFETNDPNNPNVALQILAKGVNAPKASISTDEILVVMDEGQETSETFTIANAENSADLLYNIFIDLEEENSFTATTPLDFYADLNQQQSVVKTLGDYNFGSSNFTLSNNSDIILDTLNNIPLRTTGAVNVGGKIYTVSYSTGELILYNPENQTIEQAYSIRDVPYGITFDGNTLWVGGQQSSIVIGYDFNGNEVGSFEVPFSSIFLSLAFDGENILAAPALNTIATEIYALNIDGSINKTYSINSPNSVMMSSMLVSNNNLWLINFYNQLNVLERYTVGEQEMVYVEENVTGIPVDIYSMAQYRNELLILPFFDAGYILEDGISGWLSSNPASGAVSANENGSIGLNFNSTGLEEGTHRATVFINTNDPSNSQLQLNAILSIGNYPPELVGEMSDTTLYMEYALDTVIFEMDLSNYFTDDKTIDLEFEVTAVNQDVVEIFTSNSKMIINPTSVGQTEIIVTAFDGELYGRTSFLVSVEEILGTNSALQNIQVFPNPTSGLLNIVTQEVLDFMIFDLRGRAIPLNLIKTDLGYQIDLSNSNDGLYLIKAVNEKSQEFSMKFMKN